MKELFVILYLLATTTVGWVIVGLTALIIVIVLWTKGRNRKRRAAEQEERVRLLAIQAENDAATRRAAILDKYDAETAKRILSGQIWQGMTAEQLQDAVGRPEAVDQVVTKRTNKEIWKYWQQTATRYDLRVTLERGVVVGWQMK